MLGQVDTVEAAELCLAWTGRMPVTTRTWAA